MGRIRPEPEHASEEEGRCVPATELGRGVMKDDVLWAWCCGRGLFGGGGVPGSMTTVLLSVSAERPVALLPSSTSISEELGIDAAGGGT